jgi:hypothetical protein
MQPININIPQHQRPQQQPQQPRSLLTQQPGTFDWLAPPSVTSAIGRLLVSVGGGLIFGAISRVIPWGPEASALVLLPILAAVVGLSFLWQRDRRGCWIALAYALFGVIGCGLTVGFGGDGQ